MARKDFPWHASDMKFGNNVVFDLILLLLFAVYYIIVGIVYLVMTIAEFAGLKKSHKTLSPTHKTEETKGTREEQIPALYNGQKWLVLINDRNCDYAKCFEEKGYIYINTLQKNKPNLTDIVYLYTAKGRRVRFKTQVVELDVQRQDEEYWRVQPPKGLTCKLRLVAEYKGWELCLSKLNLNGGFGSVETIKYPISNNENCHIARLLYYIEKHFCDSQNIIIAEDNNKISLPSHNTKQHFCDSLNNIVKT